MTTAVPARPRRLAGVPAAVALAIAGAWALAIAAQATGSADWAHHDTLIERGTSLWLGVALSLVAWQAMTAAMMLPSSLPLIRLFAQASARQPRPHAAMAGFVGGYALVWTGFGALAFLGDAAVHRIVDASPALRAHEWAIGGLVLALAGGFQFTSLKDACLRQCRHPGAFLLRYYERGTGGGFRLGARHGAFCVGCCWALMLVMFAVGVANLVWMAALTVLMVHEKTRPLGARGVPVTGVALLGAASITLLYSANASGALR
jgi:predicted metal-binding membrane protein